MTGIRGPRGLGCAQLLPSTAVQLPLNCESSLMAYRRPFSGGSALPRIDKQAFQKTLFVRLN